MKNMKKVLSLTVLVLLMSIMALSASAQGPQSYSSGYQVQNLDETNQATVEVKFYNPDGSVDTTSNFTIPAGGSKTFFPLQAGIGFNGSAVISSNTRIAAISNLVADNISFGSSYTGFSEGSATASLPLIMKGNGSFDTWFSVQNAGDTATDITVSYAGTSCSEAATIQPGAAAQFDQKDNTCLSNGYVGAATVTTASASDRVVVTVIETGDTTLFAYNGFTGGATNPVMPLINSNNGGYITGVQIQNTGAASTNVTLSYTPSAAGAACTETKTIPAGDSRTFALYAFSLTNDPNPGTDNCAFGAQFVGSAVVTTNSGNTPLVSIVNQVSLGANKGSSYSGFDPAQATSTVVAPLIMDRNGSYWTGTQVLNVGSSAVDITCTFTDGSTTRSFSQNVASGAAFLNLQDGALAAGFVGSGICEASGGSIVGIVNEVNLTSSGDSLFTYEMVND